MRATFRYEFLMQLRRPTLWIVYGFAFALTAAMGSAFFTLDLGFTQPGDSRAAMLALSRLCLVLLPIAYGCMIADRLVRDRRIGVAEVLDTTPAGRTGRLVGKYVGVCLATAVPLMLVYFGRATVYVIAEGQPGGLGWAAVIFLARLVPGLIFVGALALAGPLLVPVTLFRVLFVVYWFWGNLIPMDLMPTVSRSLLAANDTYAEMAWFYQQEPGVEYAPWPDPEAAFNVLRPEPTSLTTVLWMGIMLALAVALLGLARLRSES